MQNLKSAATLVAAVIAACTIDARDRQRFEGTGPEETGEPEAPAPAGCVLHSDCPDGQACMNGACAAVEPQPDAGAPAADAAESESESEAEAEAEAESESESESEGEPDAGPPAEGDAGVPPADGAPDGAESESESEAEAEAEAESESEADAGAPSADGAAAPPADGGAPTPDAGAPDAGPVCVAQPVTVVIPVPEGETVDASAKFCSTFPGGWTCEFFALGGESGREIRASFASVAPAQHVFNACLRNCDDPLNGVWMAYYSNGLQQRGDPVVTVGESVAPESLVSNGGSGANWLDDTQPFSCG